METGAKVLVVDDEKLVCWSLSEMLTEAGFKVETALTGADARKMFESFQPEMILLDVRLPDANGIELLSEFKAHDEDVVVVMITAYADADSAVNALKIGADDYMTKPFSPRELVSRVRAVLRRTEMSGVSTHGLIEVDERLKLDFGRHEVWVEDQLVKLRPTEYRLLYHLVQNAGWVLTHDQILTKVWGYEYRDEPHYVRLYINYLRQKIEKDPANPVYILTERGVGYRFIDFRRDKALLNQ